MRHAVAWLLLLGACGAQDSGYPPDGGGMTVDARPSASDAAPICQVRMSVTPADPVAPVTLEATAVLSGASGFINLTWSVSGPEGPVTVRPQDVGGLRVSFMATVAGPYLVGGSATDGGRFCQVIPATVNVIAVGAGVDEVQLRYVPRSGTAPAQLDPQVILLRGGSDFALPAPRVIDRGTSVSGTVTGPSGAVPAYLRLDGEAGFLELFTDASGRYQGSVTTRAHDVLVVPYDDALPPAIFADASPTRLSGGFSLDAGDAVSGVVRAGTTPIASARVALSTGGLPPVVVETDATGRFDARVRAAAGPLSLLVVPPPPHARLQLAAGPMVAAGAELAIQLAEPALVPRTLVARDSTGSPLPGARVTFAGAAAPGGSVRLGDGTPLPATSQFRQVVVAGENGALPPVELPDGVTVLVAPPAGSSEVLGVAPLGPGDPGSAAAASTSVVVRGPELSAIAGARVVAVALGLHGVGRGQTVSGKTGQFGGIDLAGLVPGMRYQVTVDAPPEQRVARGHAELIGGQPLPAIVLRNAVRLSGSILFSSGTPPGGVRVEATCASCADRTAVLAEAVTSAAGDFSLLLPDPGVD